MDIRTSKIELVKMILNIDNNDFIQKLTEFIKSENTDFWNKLNPAQRSEIKKGIQELDNGKRVSYDDVLKKISK